MIKKSLRKTICCLLSALLIGATLTGCLGDEYEEDFEEEENSSKGTITRNSILTVDNSTGVLSVNRPHRDSETPMGESGTWTVFVYICGSDLESNHGMGTSDMEEMLSAQTGDKVKFVVETGGARSWQNPAIDPNSLQRFVIQNGDMQEVYSEPAKNMGDTAVITDFLRWGVKEYPAEHMAVVFWNHGSGSINGVCFDETNDNDSLSLLEIDGALYSIYPEMTDRFELIGFDACLMGSIEAANVLANYSRYMVGSEEVEPGYGWDYTVIGNFLGSNPTANGAELGKTIADGFKASNVACNDDEQTTLSVIDLEKMDNLLVAFNAFAKQMYEAGSDANNLSDMIRLIQSTENFGGNNKSEGYTNMVDLGGLIQACSSFAPEASSALSALNDCVTYKVSGPSHSNASGLSVYYPLEIQGSAELSIFETVCVSPYYLSFVDRQDTGSSYATGEEYIPENNENVEEIVPEGNEGENGTVEEIVPEGNGTENGVVEETVPEVNEGDNGTIDDSNTEVVVEYWYDDDGWYDDSWCYDENNCWNSSCEYEYDDSSDCYRRMSASKDHWTYADNIEPTGESRLITFASKPALNDEGYYTFSLDSRGIENAAAVYAVIYQLSDDGKEYIEIGETFDVVADWDKGVFEDMFDGYWLSLPDGQNLATYIVDYDEDYVIYTSPILLNGEETNLRIRLDDNGATIEGAWDGLDENGAASKNITKLKDGDVIVPRYFSYDVDTEEEGEWQGVEYKVSGTPEIDYGYLDNADYFYAFCIDDVYYDYYLTDFVQFNLDEEGNVSYYLD